jgi:methionyl-tRNA formyltransferase
VKIAVIGGVRSTEILLDKAIFAGFNQIRVWGYEPVDKNIVSTWSDLKQVSEKYKLEYSGFNRIGEIFDAVSNFCPDILFAVGISQIIPTEMLRIAKLINVGFHPTALPKGRGRAPIAWIVLDRVPAAATFFELGMGADDGAILAQIPFNVDEDDDAASVEKKLLEAESVALDSLLPMLRDGVLIRQEQCHSDADWYGRRTPEDGLIDWSQDAVKISRLIKASAPPHPGAFTYSGDSKVSIFEASIIDIKSKGVVGGILFQEQDWFDVQTGNGHLRVSKWSSDSSFRPRAGAKLGYHWDIEIFELRREVKDLQIALANLAGTMREL